MFAFGCHSQRLDANLDRFGDRLENAYPVQTENAACKGTREAAVHRRAVQLPLIEESQTSLLSASSSPHQIPSQVFAGTHSVVLGLISSPLKPRKDYLLGCTVQGRLLMDQGSSTAGHPLLFWSLKLVW